MVGEVLALMKDLANMEITVVIVTHEMRFAREVADRVIFFDNGVNGEKEFFGNPQNQHLKDFLSKML